MRANCSVEGCERKWHAKGLYDGQIGAEATPDEFVTSLLEVTAECVRVLKPTGSLWVNLGDKYSGPPAGNKTPSGFQQTTEGLSTANRSQFVKRPATGIPNKSLIGIPWRYALRCIDDLGLILRAEVIWSKPNGLPESVTDRPRRSHEQWFMFTLQPRYFSAVDEIREAHDERYAQRRLTPQMPRAKGNHDGEGGWKGALRTEKDVTGNPLGKLPGSVWTIPTEPLRVPDHLGVDHFAAFPTEWPRRIIAGWSPAGVCTACGEGRRPVSRTEHERPTGGWKPDRDADGGANRPVGNARPSSLVSITGYACACPEPTADTTPAVVLDPFGGTGTAALVAKALGRHGVTIDMSADYCRLAQWRVNDPASLAHAARVDKPAPQTVGQESLLDLLGGEGA